jgi:hypothetical protein
MTKAWQDVLALFEQVARKNAAISPMHMLVRDIAATEFAGKLHRWTSMLDLCISQMASANPHESPYLRVLRVLSKICVLTEMLRSRRCRRGGPAAAGVALRVRAGEAAVWIAMAVGCALTSNMQPSPSNTPAILCATGLVTAVRVGTCDFRLVEKTLIFGSLQHSGVGARYK